LILPHCNSAAKRGFAAATALWTGRHAATDGGLFALDHLATEMGEATHQPEFLIGGEAPRRFATKSHGLASAKSLGVGDL